VQPRRRTPVSLYLLLIWYLRELTPREICVPIMAARATRCKTSAYDLEASEIPRSVEVRWDAVSWGCCRDPAAREPPAAASSMFGPSSYSHYHKMWRKLTWSTHKCCTFRLGDGMPCPLDLSLSRTRCQKCQRSQLIPRTTAFMPYALVNSWRHRRCRRGERIIRW
jgi:hypothetical protein